MKSRILLPRITIQIYPLKGPLAVPWRIRGQQFIVVSTYYPLHRQLLADFSTFVSLVMRRLDGIPDGQNPTD